MNSTTCPSLRGELRLNEPLAKYTTWHAGGVASRFFKPVDLDDLSVFLATVPEDEPLVWLGLGSNVLIRDGGVPGTVIHTLGTLGKIQISSDSTIRAEAGVTCAKIAKFCVKEAFAKGAFFAGIPGTVGGALAMNAGAFGEETWNYVVKVETINRKGHIRHRFSEEFTVGYREVIRPSEEWFVAGHFKFPQGNAEETQKNIKALLKKRNETQPIGEFSCGSVFRNPPGDYAARLIESCGLKGKRIGGAVVSPKHANFIINSDNATAQDIEQLIELVQRTVQAKTNVVLIQECHFIGESLRNTNNP